MGRFSRLGPSPERVRSYGLVLAFGVLYLVVARTSISLLGSVGVSGFSGPVVWPASGLYVGALLVANRRLWALLAGVALAGSLAAHLDAGSSLAVSLGFAVPNAAEGLFAALLVRRGADRRTFERPGDIAALVLGGAVVGGAVLSLSAAAVARYGMSAPFGGSWVRWWTADGLGMLLVAPLVSLTRERLGRVNAGAEVATAVVVAGVSVGAYVACAVHPWDGAGVLGAVIALPFALLAGWRWGPGGAAAAVLPVAIASACRGAHDATLFASGSAASAQVLAVQGALATVALAALVATTGAAQRARLSAAVGEVRDRLRRVLDMTSDACVSLDERDTIIAWNRRAEALFGWPAAEALDMNLYETLVAPSAAERWTAALARETAAGSAIELPAWHRSGDELQVEVVVAPRSPDTGGADLFFRDVSERERLSSEVERLSGELEAKGRDLERTLREREQLRGNLARAHGQQVQTDRALADRSHALASAERRVEKLEHELRSTRESRDRALQTAGRERDALEQRLSALEGELSGAREASERLERELAEAHGRQREADEELARARERASEVELAVDEARRLHAETAAELDEARSLHAETTAELDEAQRRRVETERELERERQTRVETDAALDRERQTRVETDAELERERDNHAETDAELERERQTRVETDAALARERDNHAETIAEVERVRHAQADVAAQLERTGERVADLERALTDSHDRRTEIEAALTSTQDRMAATAAELDDVRQQAAETEDALRATTESRAKAEAELSQLALEAERLAGELSALRQKHQRAERALEEAELARAAKERRLLAEQRRLESALIATAKSLAAAQGNGYLSEGPDGHVTALYDGSGICLYASPAWVDAFGWQNEELVGEQGSRLIHPDDRPLVQRARAQRSESHFETRIRNKQGGFTHAEATFRPVRDNDDRLIAIETTLRPLSAKIPISDPHAATEAQSGPPEAKVRPPLRMV
jgi:PAS domain S-box-containing protein